MAKQTYTAGQVLTAAQMTTLQANDYNQTVSTKVASYILAAADAGTRIVMNSASATTITVNTSLFTAGDTLFIQNIGAGLCTITAGTATVTTANSLVLAQWGGGTLYFTSASAAIFLPTGNGYTTFTPSLANYTRGNGTTDSRYIRIGNFVHVYVKETFGTTSSLTGNVSINLPIAPRSASSVTAYGTFTDTGGSTYPLVSASAGTDCYFYAINTAGTYALSTILSATIPFTWGNTDVIQFTVIYEAA